MTFSTKEKIYVTVIILLVALCAQFYYSYSYAPQYQVRVYYNQDRPLNKELVNTIREAEHFVYFAVYTFTRTDIKDALLAAKYRGLEVKGITDKNQYKQIEQQQKIIDELRKEGIEVYEQDHSAIMHLKTLVTDRAYISGSYNWTSAATNLNDEVLEIGHEESIRSQYEKILKELFGRYSK
ncbi:MAG: hypothetical protein JNN11_05310 [Candidatus Doudnabacteria bacterium]|nr:hypothetical protein [Candidatus Doudnabacteria bacterium]